MTSRKKNKNRDLKCLNRTIFETYCSFLALDGVESAGGGEESDSFNSVTCFCGKPFAGRPMIECSGCLTWLHMSCAKVKRKNIPEFYYCEGCKGSGSLLSPSSINLMGTSTASSGEESANTPNRSRSSQNGTNSITDVFMSHQNQNLSTANTKSRKKPKLTNASLMSSSDNIQNKFASADPRDSSNASDQIIFRKKSSSSNVNGKTTKKMRQKPPSNSSVPSNTSAASLTELSLNHQAVASTQLTLSNGIPTNVLKSPIATNNNNIFLESTQDGIEEAENGSDKFNKRLKLL